MIDKDIFTGDVQRLEVEYGKCVLLCHEGGVRKITTIQRRVFYFLKYIRAKRLLNWYVKRITK